MRCWFKFPICRTDPCPCSRHALPSGGGGGRKRGWRSCTDANSTAHCDVARIPAASAAPPISERPVGPPSRADCGSSSGGV